MGHQRAKGLGVPGPQEPPVLGPQALREGRQRQHLAVSAVQQGAHGWAPGRTLHGVGGFSQAPHVPAPCCRAQRADAAHLLRQCARAAGKGPSWGGARAKLGRGKGQEGAGLTEEGAGSARGRWTGRGRGGSRPSPFPPPGGSPALANPRCLRRPGPGVSQRLAYSGDRGRGRNVGYGGSQVHSMPPLVRFPDGLEPRERGPPWSSEGTRSACPWCGGLAAPDR